MNAGMFLLESWKVSFRKQWREGGEQTVQPVVLTLYSCLFICILQSFML